MTCRELTTHQQSAEGEETNRLPAVAALPVEHDARTDEQRIRAAQSDAWIETAMTRAARLFVDGLIERAQDGDSRMAVIGAPAANGLTRFAKQLQAEDHLVFPWDRRLPRISMPTVEPDLWTELARVLFGPDRTPRDYSRQGGLRMAVFRELTKPNNRPQGPKILFVDDAHNLLLQRSPQREAMLRLLRHIANEASVPLVLLGSFDLAVTLANDPGWRERLEFAALPPFVMDDAYADILGELERRLPLRRPSRLTEPALAAAMLDASRGALGPLLRIVRDGAVAAIRDGSESITLRLLARYGLVRAEVGQ